jgi:hypothetical protein
MLICVAQSLVLAASAVFQSAPSVCTSFFFSLPLPALTSHPQRTTVNSHSLSEALKDGEHTRHGRSGGGDFAAASDSFFSLASHARLLSQGICNSSQTEPQQSAPRSNGRSAAGSNGQHQQQQQQKAPAHSSAGQSTGGKSSAATESERRRARAAAAENRVKQQQNRGKSTTGGGRSNNGNGTEDSLLYPSLHPQDQPSPGNGQTSKREKSAWEVENADALGSTIIQTNEKA